MTRKVHIVAVCKGLAADSVTRVALREASQAAQAAGAQTTLVDFETLWPYARERYSYRAFGNRAILIK